MSFGKETLGFFKDKEILLLEDDLLLAKRITAAIEKTGGAVTHCQNLEQAQNALNDLSFEAALPEDLQNLLASLGPPTDVGPSSPLPA